MIEAGYFLQVLLFAAMPGCRKLFGWYGGFAAGIVLAVVGIELMPGALTVEQPCIALWRGA